MAKTKKATSEAEQLRVNSQRAVKLSFVFIAIYIVQILIYTAWKLLTRDALTERWSVIAAAFAATSVLYLFSRQKNLSSASYRGTIVVLTCVYIAIASFSIYTERGMASNSIILYTIPIIIASLTYSAKTLFATAALAAVTYSASAISYFKHFPSEGYKVELYGQLVYYGAVLFLVAALLWVIVRSKQAR